MSSTALQEQPPQAVLDLRLQVDDYLRRLVFSGEPITRRLGAAMRYSLLAGGKRVRPVIALATAEVLGRAPASVLPLAAGLEMIHTHSLIHVDLPAIDDDDVRRGKPSAHVAFGDDVALLAGDALFAEAIALVLREQEGEPALVLAAVAELMQAVGVTGLLGGRYIDVATADDLDEGGLRQLHELKTGRLLAAAVETVLTLTGESGPATAALRRFAAEVGMLFQISEDILDATTRGEPRAGEAPHARHTSVSLFGIERACELARESHAIARAALAEAPADTSALECLTDYILARHGESPGG